MKALLVVLSDIAKWSIWLALGKLLLCVAICIAVGFMTASVVDAVDPAQEFFVEDFEFSINTISGLAIIGLFVICALVFAGIAVVGITLGILTAVAYFLFEFKYDVKAYIRSVKRRTGK